jgi:hypothetical protein
MKCAIFVPLSYHSLIEGEIYVVSYHSLSEGEIYVVSPKSSKFSFFGTVKRYTHLS